ncbi:hypothetical protein [Shewanella cyperi]|uniref:Cytochrome oxidase assembly protein n=1 Tax=Shewanella cyperi TaxID=2814292 RepID=A0A974XKH1_9GAMM|nr:hypothetical protein [Shewanella cyperi]QSX29969.1 hypothetical protein JYB88_17615 [Shewanella cyperi]QSX40745.1 hypothetical protein JYB84_17675 [Shewanella cyperi]
MTSRQRKSARPLVLLLLAFVVPVVLAKLVLSQHWYQEAATNQGTLLPGDTNYNDLGMNNPKPRQWQVLYLLPATCDDFCRERLYLLQQSHTALGRDMDRVIPLILLNADSDIAALQDRAFTTAQASTAISQLLAGQQLLVVDPLGNLVMRYPALTTDETQLQQGKALLADLRKLLKLSRVG